MYNLSTLENHRIVVENLCQIKNTALVADQCVI